MIRDGITSCFDDTIPLGLSWARYQITLRFQEAVPRPKSHSYRRHFLRKQREQHLRPADLSLLELVTILLLMRPPPQSRQLQLRRLQAHTNKCRREP